MSRILIVEDDPELAELFSLEVEDRHHEAHLATNGQEALEMARSVRPDAILMDRHMPIMDGLEATRRLRGDPATRDIAIVILTASVMPNDRERALSCGCDHLEEKPPDYERLFTKLEELIRRRSK
jgi:two-component system, cell cycle response regulator DivK